MTPTEMRDSPPKIAMGIRNSSGKVNHPNLNQKSNQIEGDKVLASISIKFISERSHRKHRETSKTFPITDSFFWRNSNWFHRIIVSNGAILFSTIIQLMNGCRNNQQQQQADQTSIRIKQTKTNSRSGAVCAMPHAFAFDLVLCWLFGKLQNFIWATLSKHDKDSDEDDGPD